jgi:hypothetical protein
MSINENKTEIIVFRNGGPVKSYEKWLYNGSSVKVTSMYKYMGLLFTPNTNYLGQKQKLNLLHKLGNLFMLLNHIKEILERFYTMIILNYLTPW